MTLDAHRDRPAPAHPTRRLVGITVDVGIILTVWFLILLFIETYWLGQIRSDWLSGRHPNHTFPPYSKTTAGILASTATIPFAFCYFVVLEALTSRTIGKLITGTHVRTTGGDCPNLFQVFLRTATRFVPFDPLTFLNANKAGLHDRLSNTTVILINDSKAGRR